MIIVLKADIKADSLECQQILEKADSFPKVSTAIHEIKGQTRSVTEIYLLGSTGMIPTSVFEDFSCVERVVRVTEKFRSIGRHGGQLEGASFEYNGLTFSQDSFHLFPGLCAVDTPEHVEDMFRTLKSHNIQCSRAGAYKPRTSPYDFQGYGKICLPYVFELAGKYDIRAIAMEITHESHIDEIYKALAQTGNATGVILQIGTRNAQNFELLKEVGNQKELPVLFKRGMGITLEESLNACEYVASAGNRNIIFALRGVKSHLGEPHRNLVDFAHVPVVKRLTRLPVCIDPSHSVGQRSVSSDGLLDIFHVAAQGIIAGGNGVLVDFHPCPEKALCDGPTSLPLKNLESMLTNLQAIFNTHRM